MEQRDLKPLKISYLHPLRTDGLSARLSSLRHAGFSHVCVAPVFARLTSDDVFLADDLDRADPELALGETADDAVHRLAALCADAGLNLLLDLVLDRVADRGATARSAPHLFFRNAGPDVIDPRQSQIEIGALPARFDHPDAAHALHDLWTERMVRLVQAGAAGFRLLGFAHVPAPSLKDVIASVRARRGALFLGWTPGLPWPQFKALEDSGLDGVFSSSSWWDARAPWFVEEHNQLACIAPRVIGVAEAPFEQRIAARIKPGAGGLAMHRRALRIAAATGGGVLVPSDFGHGIDLNEDIATALRLVDDLAPFNSTGEARLLTGQASPVTALFQVDTADARTAERGIAILINTDDKEHPVPVAFDPLQPPAGAAFGDPLPLGGAALDAPLAAGDVRVVAVRRTKPVADRMRRDARALAQAMKGPRVAIERVTPSVDDGAFPVKRIVGRPITVEADVFTDGHDIVAAELLWKAVDEREWTRVPLAHLGNDRWQADFTPRRVGRHVFTVEGWCDDYASLCHEIEVKHQAGVDISLELTEARLYLERVYARAVPCNTTALSAAIKTLEGRDTDASLQSLTSPRTVRAVAVSEDRPFAVQHSPIPLEIERPQAEFASWYELFPRSQSGDVARHGTFDDVIARLPDVRRMGFDVLYFPPIHPIGRKNRKGRNNTLTPGPDDVGSPYAIGSDEGGHDAIHPQLGTLADFRRLIAAARENGLEIALDFAIQCSPDHPWLRDHPDWFKWRPDGTIKYAENPPKKYQDIVNVDFYGGDAPGLWIALRDVVLYWAGEGIRIFRVDNPHTKPLPFWQWMIAEVRARYPDAIFLSEAFTRPKVMYRLAKVGFSQSYTYFTWRNTKAELAEYLTELTTTDVKDFFRPHFFVNTPDINPYFLQTSGRPGFLIRAALAATLSGLWGVYSGFEVCEAAALPGREEYLDSEKYEIRVRDQNAPGNIVAEITTLNRLRKAHPALQSHLGVTFYNAFNDRILLYGKRAPGGEDMILVAVSLDPHNVQEATFELPLWEWKLPDHGSLYVEDLMRGGGTVWTGKLQRVRLEPAELPFAIWRLALPGSVP